MALFFTDLPTSPEEPAGLISLDLKTGRREAVTYAHTSDGAPRNFPSTTHGPLVDRNGQIWVGAYGSVARFLPGQSKGLVELDRDEGKVDKYIGWVWDLAEYNDRYLLAAAAGGLFVFDKQSKKFVQQFRYHSSNLLY